jgi:acylphosphatase
MKNMVCRRVEISGIVQGVGFRWRARQFALELGIGGWIKNRPDGKVEAVFQGPDVLVREILEWARKGPAGAEVTDFRQFNCDCDPALWDFAIIRGG